jgi:hypothetical protein
MHAHTCARTRTHHRPASATMHARAHTASVAWVLRPPGRKSLKKSAIQKTKVNWLCTVIVTLDGLTYSFKGMASKKGTAEVPRPPPLRPLILHFRLSLSSTYNRNICAGCLRQRDLVITLLLWRTSRRRPPPRPHWMGWSCRVLETGRWVRETRARRPVRARGTVEGALFRRQLPMLPPHRPYTAPAGTAGSSIRATTTPVMGSSTATHAGTTTANDFSVARLGPRCRQESRSPSRRVGWALARFCWMEAAGRRAVADSRSTCHGAR